jgi:hypothetical protein
MENKQVKIELRRLSVNMRLSKETYNFVADLYINGKKAGTAENDGHGGMTHISPDYNNLDACSKLIKLATDYYKSLPQEKIDMGANRSFMVQPTLDYAVDKLVESEVAQKESLRAEKQIERDCVKAICFGSRSEGGISYRMVKYKVSIEEILARPDGKEVIRKQIQQIRQEMNQGEEIFNKNIPEELLA